MPKVLFVQPAMGWYADSRRYIRSWQMAPLAMGVLSALTPRHWDRALVDDRLETIDYDQPADLVAISMETYTARRAYQIAREFRQRGRPVVLGGYHATACPDEAMEHAEAVCVGRAEGTWKRILADATAGRLAGVYRSREDQRVPWGRVDRSVFAGKNYVKLDMVESSRGCPHACRFCSIAGFYGSRFERRDTSEVVGELEEIAGRNIFFVDDNFAGDRSGTLDLIRAIKPLRKRWMTQVSMHVARDSQLLDAMAESGCIGALIGFESTDPQAVGSMDKRVNAHVDYHDVVRQFTRRGMAVYGTFLFGYDGDSVERQRGEVELAVDSGMFMAAMNHLVPFPGPTLYEQLRREKRLLADQWWLQENYRFGQIAFKPRAFTPEGLGQATQAARASLYSLKNLARRGLRAPKARNLLLNHATYWFINLAMRKERSRFGWPMGQSTATPQRIGIRRENLLARIAEPSNELDAELRELMLDCPMEGTIEKTSYPAESFFQSLHPLGRRHRVVTLRDRSGLNRLIGVGVLSEKPVWLAGQVQTVGYLSLLRLRKEYRGGMLLARGFRRFVELLGDDIPRLCFTPILHDNQLARRSLLRRRPSIPAYSPAFGIQCLLTRPSQGHRLRHCPEISLSRGTESDLPEILAFWNVAGQQRDLCPVYEPADLSPSGMLAGLRPTDLVVARRRGAITATCALWDQQALRRYRLDRYRSLLGPARPWINPALRLAGLPQLPAPGRDLNLRHVAMSLSSDDESAETALRRVLLDCDDSQATIVATVAEADPMRPILDRLRGFRQPSSCYSVALKPDAPSPELRPQVYLEGGGL